MLSEKQIQEKMTRVKLVVDSFLSYDRISINELSRIIGVPTSTIQRDLNDIEFIQLIYKEETKNILEKISKILKENKAHGLRMGGKNSTANNEPIRDENGKFIGNKKR